MTLRLFDRVSVVVVGVGGGVVSVSLCGSYMCTLCFFGGVFCLCVALLYILVVVLHFSRAKPVCTATFRALSGVFL